ncbi:hypothetical protein B0J18DRAFT_169371 [Chaetomium sp. MPI-SDFR-AT-0129]|nr:hypothetical protein B0J18DRAFT_169371 [Chaetomium sp. MPI-SDFR-AT-0129]
MEAFPPSRQAEPTAHPKPRHLNRSNPSSHSLSSTASPGTSTPRSWSANEWLGGTPDTSPPSSGIGSPELKAKLTQEDDAVSTFEEPIAHCSRKGSAKSVCFVGAGFVGGPTAAVIAYHNPEIRVNVVDLNTDRVAAWNSSHLPIHEDGLLKVVRVARDGTLPVRLCLSGSTEPIGIKARNPNLVFSTNVVPAIAEADIIFICVNTPTKTHGLGAGSMADVSAVESATRTVAEHAKKGAIIVEKSTVPCGTARMIQEILRYHRQNHNFEVLSNPEFLAEGTAVENLMYPDRILIGSDRTPAGCEAAAVLKDVYSAWVPPDRIITVNTFSSELAKLVANTMLAQRISSINAVSAMCEEIGLGADVDDVSLAIGKDLRLGPKFLQAGIGFGGSCFEKDILNLAYLARELHLDVVAEYWLAVLKINEDQRQRFARNVVKELNGSLRGKKIAVLGFAFKDGTNDTRNSIAVHVIRDLVSEMPREIAIFDPGCAPGDIENELRAIGLPTAQMERIKISSSWRRCVEEASAACILTQWKHFRGQSLGASPSDDTRKMTESRTHQFTAHNTDDCPDEMAITELEAMTQQEVPTFTDDPLERLKPLASCAPECNQCRDDEQGFRNQEPVDWAEVATLMREPRWVFDGRNVVNHDELQRLGLKVKGVGKGFPSP